MIGDSPYIIDAQNFDQYPLMTPWSIPETIDELITKVDGLSSEEQFGNQGIPESLIANLNSIQRFVDKENIEKAGYRLENLMKKIETMPYQLITPTAKYVLNYCIENVISNL